MHVYSNNTDHADTVLCYRYSRHPNYAGEIVLWTGMFVFCASSLQGNDLYGGKRCFYLLAGNH